MLERWVRRRCRRKMGGNKMILGFGGFSLSNHHTIGKMANPARAQGTKNERAPTDHISRLLKFPRVAYRVPIELVLAVGPSGAL